jgi:hypothetical protein
MFGTVGFGDFTPFSGDMFNVLAGDNIISKGAMLLAERQSASVRTH